MNPKVEVSSPTCKADQFLSKNFDTHTRTSVRHSRRNAVACAQLTLQMLTLQTDRHYHEFQDFRGVVLLSYTHFVVTHPIKCSNLNEPVSSHAREAATLI